MTLRDRLFGPRCADCGKRHPVTLGSPFAWGALDFMECEITKIEKEIATIRYHNAQLSRHLNILRQHRAGQSVEPLSPAEVNAILARPGAEEPQ